MGDDYPRWRAAVQKQSGMSDERMREIEAGAQQAFNAGISPTTYADMSD